jgi:ABC-type multidrug transport system fused ATPase/permease subunit
VLKGLNLKINANEQVALVGESGCGKSTFVNLLMRFYEVDSGSILLDGVDIREYNLHELRKALSLVMQEPIVFNYSILENVLYGKTDASNDEVYEATSIANANEFIENSEAIADKEEEETSAALVKAMTERKDELISYFGKAKYEEHLATLK